MSGAKEPPFKEKSTKTKRSPSTKRPNPRLPSIIPEDRTRNQRINSNSDSEAQPGTSKQKNPVKSKSEPNINKTVETEIEQKTETVFANEIDPERLDNEQQELLRNKQETQEQTELPVQIEEDATFQDNLEKQDKERKTKKHQETQEQIQVHQQIGEVEDKTVNIQFPVTEPPQEANIVDKQIADIRQVQLAQAPKLNNTEDRQSKSKMANTREIQKTIADIVPEFSGEGGERVTTDLTRFLGLADSAYGTLTTPEEKKIFGELIKFRLTGNAYERIENRQIDDYKTFRTVLNNMYTRVIALSELERRFVEIKQAYGESPRSFGQRVIEALECYKNGYKRKYNVAEIDNSYTTHLGNAAVLTFKKGLNNTIIKDRIATIKAKDVDEIVEQTEDIERMLKLTNGETALRATHEVPQQNHTNKADRNQYQGNPVICNYCSKPNHTYDMCRQRIWSQNRPQFQSSQQYSTNQYNQRYATSPTQLRAQPSNVPRNQQQTTFRQPAFQNYKASQSSHVTNYQSNPTEIIQRFNNYRRPPDQRYTLDRPPKYCSFCKTTVGHTFEECRSKFRRNQDFAQNNLNNYEPRPRTENTNLEEKFANMRINLIAAQPQNDMPQMQEPQSGNEHGLAPTQQ